MPRGILCVFAITLMLCGCSEKKDPVSSKPPENALELSPREDAEAEIGAMLMLDTLVAPTWAYDRVKRDLAMIRAQFSGSYPEVNIAVKAPWSVGQLMLGFDHTTYNLIKGNSYNQWDDLNETFRMESIQFWDDYNILILVFIPRLNPTIIKCDYEGLPGLKYAAATGFTTDQPQNYIGQRDGLFHYFFRDAWGDCPNGCINNHIFYFTTTTEGDAKYIGDYLVQNPDDTAPTWFQYFIETFQKW